MTTMKKLGVWLDHSSAHLMEFKSNTLEASIISSKFTHFERETTLNKGGHMMHNKEQHLQSDYYKELGEIIKNYEEVILFGPADAKNELFNTLRRDRRRDRRFEKIKIEVAQADKMTENQQHAFVREHFLKES